MFILILIFLVFIQFQFGLLVSIQITIWLLVYFLSNLLLGFNPWSKQLLVIRLMSIFVIIFILYYNSKDIFISTTAMIPLSINKISYLDDLDNPVFIDFESQKLEILSKLTIEETNDFIKKLNDNETYLVELEFIPTDEIVDVPHLILCEPFLINQYSSSTTIRKFILERLNKMVDCFYLDDSIIEPVIHHLSFWNFQKFI